MVDQYRYNLVLLGGTGAKCGEIFLHMCANGYFAGDRVNIMYIDSDDQNGNARNFKRLYELYQECQNKYMIVQSSNEHFFKTKITLRVADPVPKNIEYFRELIHSAGGRNVTSAARVLMGALYSEEEMEMKIAEGFFAHPNVGAAVLAANIDNIMKEFLADIEQDQKDMKKIRIFLLGSVFGGTGAASLPTIARYFKSKLIGDSDNKNIRKQVKIGGCMILPYFSFTRNEKNAENNQIEGISVDAGKFATQTCSALEYYKYLDEKKDDRTFDDLYLLGHDGNDVRGIYALMGNEQRNLPHIVELYGAMSCVAFFESKAGRQQYYFAAVGTDKISWSDIYKKNQGYFCFFVMMRFAIVMKSLVLEELFDYTKQNKLRETAAKIPWYYDFLNGKEESWDMEPQKLYSKFEDISRYCDEYIRWFAELNLADVNKLDSLESIEYSEGSDDLVGYLSMFTKEIILRQHYNNQISNGNARNQSYVADNNYQDNLKYIRKNMQNLEKIQSYTDFKTEKISMDEIWSRLCDIGLNMFVTDDDVFKNIAKSGDKSMDAGVRNLVNAVFCACLI